MALVKTGSKKFELKIRTTLDVLKVMEAVRKKTSAVFLLNYEATTAVSKKFGIGTTGSLSIVFHHCEEDKILRGFYYFEGKTNTGLEVAVWCRPGHQEHDKLKVWR